MPTTAYEISNLVPAPVERDWRRPAEAARMLGVNQFTVRRWCASGYLAGAYRLGPGGYWCVPLTAILARLPRSPVPTETDRQRQARAAKARAEIARVR